MPRRAGASTLRACCLRDRASIAAASSLRAPGRRLRSLPWPPAGTKLRALYDRRFRAETTRAGVKLTDIETDINYAGSTAA